MMNLKSTLTVLVGAVLLFGASACTTTQYKEPKSKAFLGNRKLIPLGKQRVTFYNAHEDKWHNRVAAPVKGLRAQEGVTVAAHVNYPFFKQIYCPQLKGVSGDGILTIQDRGGAVNRRVASRGQTDIFDIFLAGKHKRLREIARLNEPYQEVYILE